ncbi:MAG: hypothetical protein HQK95_04710 [Nitrospirae bacterium]|nr:hypothetical protein [Nitrospirota bacterium]
MKKVIVICISILVLGLMLSGVVAAQGPLRDTVISGKLAEAQMLLDECYRMGTISRRAAAEIHSRINFYRESSFNTEIRHGGVIPRREAIRINNDLDNLIREVAALRSAPLPLPPPQYPPQQFPPQQYPPQQYPGPRYP